MPLSPSHIAQIAIPVRNLARAKAFYGETLGLRHLFDAPPGLSFYQCGQTRLMLSPPEGEEAGNASIIYYSVENAAGAARALAAQGVAFEEPARCIAQLADREVWLAIARDSEGNLIGLMSEQTAG